MRVVVAVARLALLGLKEPARFGWRARLEIGFAWRGETVRGFLCSLSSELFEEYY